MPTLVATTAWRTLARLAGGRCLICRAWCRDALCAACDASFAAPSARCPTCAARIASSGDDAVRPARPIPHRPEPSAACDRCRASPPPWSAAVAAIDYVPPWDALVAAFKFDARVDLAVSLAPLLARAVADAHGEASTRPADLVLPVPLAPRRLRERGYNQAWELARRTARAHGLHACADALFRARETPRQVALSRAARSANVFDAFAVAPRHVARVRGARIALVDDVLTTGATAGSAALALRRAGAADVRLWVLARTPADRPLDAPGSTRDDAAP